MHLETYELSNGKTQHFFQKEEELIRRIVKDVVKIQKRIHIKLSRFKNNKSEKKKTMKTQKSSTLTSIKNKIPHLMRNCIYFWNIVCF